MKKLIKKILPELILTKYYKVRNKIKNMKKLKRIKKDHLEYFYYDFNKIINHSNVLYRFDKEEKLIAQIITIYHSIEKGLVMSPMKPGFGAGRLNALINLCELYINKYGTENEILKDALGVISDYKNLHENFEYKLENEEKIKNLLRKFDKIDLVDQLSFSYSDYFENKESSFKDFSDSRYSLRNFDKSKNIDIELLKKAISLAQNAPSTCNRQSIRIHIIKDKQLLLDAISLQNGNRGFGDKTNKLIIVTSDLQSWESGGQLRNGPVFDAGIYTLNLLYALHYYEIGACALNWYATLERDLELRSIVNIPENENIMAMIACGLPPETFRITKSKRRNLQGILSIH